MCLSFGFHYANMFVITNTRFLQYRRWKRKMENAGEWFKAIIGCIQDFYTTWFIHANGILRCISKKHILSIMLKRWVGVWSYIKTPFFPPIPVSFFLFSLIYMTVCPVLETVSTLTSYGKATVGQGRGKKAAQLYYEIHGNGPEKVVMLSGLCTPCQYWGLQVHIWSERVIPCEQKCFYWQVFDSIVRIPSENWWVHGTGVW